MQNNRYWYSDNPFYLSGYGLPNCTCYAWGRTWEISPLHKPTLPTGNAETWFGNVGLPYTKGQIPKLGAIMCWSHPTSGGHVAIVEKINGNTITTSNSAWGGRYFYTRDYTRGNEDNGNYKFQGYIYNPYVESSVLPPRPTKWISRASGLNREEMENNALIVIYTYRDMGFADETIAAMLGNMQAESSVNPEREEDGGGGGYGLVQWTPQSVLINHCNTLGLSPYTSGDVQLKVIPSEVRNVSGVAEWYTTEAFIRNYYNSGATSDMIGITGEQFLSNSMGWSADKLAIMFMTGYERPSYDPGTNHYQQRMQNALEWLEFMGGVPPTPTTRKRNHFPIWLMVMRKRGLL